MTPADRDHTRRTRGAPAARAPCRTYRIDARNLGVRSTGVSAEVLYPTYLLPHFAMDDAKLQEVSFRAYNDWLAEFCRTAPDRLKGIAMLNVAYATTVHYLHWSNPPALPSVALASANFLMPAVCFLAAWRPIFRHLFFVPVSCTLVAIFLSNLPEALDSYDRIWWSIVIGGVVIAVLALVGFGIFKLVQRRRGY